MKTVKALLFGLPFFILASCNNQPAANKVDATDATAAPAEASSDKAFKIDNTASSLTWIGANKFTPKAHTGTLQFTEGAFTATGNILTSGKFTVDMNSMNSPGDEYTDGAAKVGNLIGHLKSADFFDVENFPTATFEITSVKPLENNELGNQEITGNLTIKGISKEITFPATVAVLQDNFTAAANFTIDRSQWEVKYGSESFFPDLMKDKLIKNEIELRLGLTGAATK